MTYSLAPHPSRAKLFSVADVHNGWAEALRGLGEQVIEYTLDARLTFFDSALMPDTGDGPDSDGRYPARKALTSEQAIDLAADGIFSECYKMWPHVVLCVSAFFTPPFVLEVMRSRGHKIVMLFTESPYQDDMQLKMAEYATLSLVNDPQNISRYREIGPAEYVPHSYREKIHYPAHQPFGCSYDLAFVGTGFPSRIRFLEAMDLDGLDVALGGFWGPLDAGSPLRRHLLSREDDGDVCVDNAETAGLYRRSRCGLNLYRREAEDTWDQQAWAMGPREVELAACGTWFTRDPRPESGELFPMLPSFTSPQEAGEQIRWALTHPASRAEAAQRAREAIADRTFTNAAKRLLALLDKQPRRQ